MRQADVGEAELDHRRSEVVEGYILLFAEVHLRVSNVFVADVSQRGPDVSGVRADRRK